MDKEFKKFGGYKIESVEEYIKDYIKQNPGTRIYIGSDSNNVRKKTVFAEAICLYHELYKDGAHVIFKRERERKIDDVVQRLWREIENVLDLGEFLEERLEGHYKRFTSNELGRMRNEDGRNIESHQNKLIDIDIDVNPIAGSNEKNLSNKICRSAVGMLEGYGYRVRTKPFAFAATAAADLLCK